MSKLGYEVIINPTGYIEAADGNTPADIQDLKNPTSIADINVENLLALKDAVTEETDRYNFILSKSFKWILRGRLFSAPTIL